MKITVLKKQLDSKIKPVKLVKIKFKEGKVIKDNK
jgi:hypothetical protein